MDKATIKHMQEIRALTRGQRIFVTAAMTVSFPFFEIGQFVLRILSGLRHAVFMSWCDVREDWALLKATWKA